SSDGVRVADSDTICVGVCVRDGDGIGVGVIESLIAHKPSDRHTCSSTGLQQLQNSTGSQQQNRGSLHVVSSSSHKAAPVGATIAIVMAIATTVAAAVATTLREVNNTSAMPEMPLYGK